LDVYALQFCNAYSTTAAAFLSYSEWDRTRMQQIVTEGRMPVTVIFGDRDRDIDRDWLAALREAGVRVHAVAGANHLWDLANASDLFDQVLHVIEGSRHG
jgi:acetyl esterase/lipase